jgi:alginate O-acetyltransferase complex protein AlgI
MKMIGFNTPLFLFLFLPLFLVLFFISGKRGKLLIGIIGSLIFYSWGSLTFLPLMLGVIILNYLLGKNLGKENSRKKKAILLWAGTLFDISLLVYFKIRHGSGFPLGLSYISFQLVSYLLDVNSGTIDREEDFLKFAFYVLLFPKIIVGPITRYGPLQEQIGKFDVTPDGVAAGIRRFIKGLAKKVLIADFLAKITVPVFDLINLTKPLIAPWLAWFVLVSYALQLYFDFSGYTDMAIGLGKMMGLQFLENFNFPYISKSISEFWRRWHISLSSWFRDYVFYPLEFGRRKFKWLVQPINILIVFSLTGLWHGITWNYLVWGALHGSAIVFESTGLGRRLRTFWEPIQHLYALAIVLISWVFFRSPNIQFALRFLLRLGGDTRGLSPLIFQVTDPLPIIDPSVILAFIFGILLCFPIGKWVEQMVARFVKDDSKLRLPLQIIYDIALFMIFALSVAALVSSSFAPGIYGKF